MARPLRLHIPGMLYHVVAHGNTKACIFTDDTDYERFLTLLVETLPRFGASCTAYCALWNHYHLLIAAGDQPVSRVLLQLSPVLPALQPPAQPRGTCPAGVVRITHRRDPRGWHSRTRHARPSIGTRSRLQRSGERLGAIRRRSGGGSGDRRHGSVVRIRPSREMSPQGDIRARIKI